MLEYHSLVPRFLVIYFVFMAQILDEVSAIAQIFLNVYFPLMTERFGIRSSSKISNIYSLSVRHSNFNAVVSTFFLEIKSINLQIAASIEYIIVSLTF